MVDKEMGRAGGSLQARSDDQLSGSISSSNNPSATDTQAQLINTIKAHIAKGEQAAKKSEQHFISAGQLLKELKGELSQAEFLEIVREKIGIGKTRTYELLAIADGTKTVEKVRAGTGQRMKRLRSKSCPSRDGQNADDPEASAVAAPEDVLENLLFALARHHAGAEAIRKVIKVSRLEDAARDEIRVAIERLISKWEAVLSKLEPRKRPAKKTDAAKRAAEYRAAKEQREREEAIAEYRAEIAAHETEAEQIAVDLIKVDRSLARRLYEHLGTESYVGAALARLLGLDGDGDDSNSVDAEASAEAMKARFAAEEVAS